MNQFKPSQLERLTAKAQKSTSCLPFTLRLQRLAPFAALCLAVPALAQSKAYTSIPLAPGGDAPIAWTAGTYSEGAWVTRNGSLCLSLKFSNTGDPATDTTDWACSAPAVTLQTNGVNNGSQSKLNLKAGSNVSISDDGSGDVTVSSTSPSTGSVSTVDVWISQIGCAQGVDLVTGFNYGTITPGTDAGPCISNYLNTHVTPGKMLILHQDGASAVSQIYGPKTGGWGIVSDNRPGMGATNVSSCTISNEVITCNTQAQNLQAGQAIMLNGFSDGTVNMKAVLLTGATATSFTGGFGHGNTSLGAGIAQSITGNGFFQLGGSNVDIIHNGSIGTTTACPGGYEDRGWGSPGLPPARGAGIVLRNLFINGNGTNQAGSGNFTSTYGPAYCNPLAISIADMNDVILDGNYTFNTFNYHERLDNVGHVRSSNQTFSDFGPGVSPTEHNGDGFHVDGNSNDIISLNDTFATGDDAWALNAAEGSVGPITEVSIVNPHYEGALSGGRMYTNSTQQPSGDNAPTLSHIVVTGGTGQVQVTAGILGNEGTTPKTVSNTFWDIHYDNNHIDMVPGAYTGNLTPGNGFVLTENGEDVTYENNSLRGLSTGTSGMVNTTAGATIHSLTMRNNTLIRTAAGHTGSSALNMQAGYYTAPGSAHIDVVAISGFNIMDADGSTYQQAPDTVLLSSPQTIGKLYVSSVDMNNLAGTVNTPAQVGSVVDQTGATPSSNATSSNVGGCRFSGTNTLVAESGTTPTLEASYQAMDTPCDFVVQLATGSSGVPFNSEMFEIDYPTNAQPSSNPVCQVSATGNNPQYTAGAVSGGSPTHTAVLPGQALPANTTLYFAVHCSL